MLFITPTTLYAKEQSALKHPQAGAFIQKMHEEHRFPISYLQNIFAQITVTELKPIKKDPNQKPKQVMTWAKYQKLFLTQNRIQSGVQFMKEYQQTLKRAVREFGVDAEVIVAIIGIETNYGRNRGKNKVLDALATLAFNPNRRRSFFTKELENALLLMREEQIDLLQTQSSYAGAIGIAQFIPSSYRHFAVDYDGDGKRDLINNPIDAIGSVANYLSQHTWQATQPIAIKMQPTQRVKKYSQNGITKPKTTLKKWQSRGIVLNNNNLSASDKAVLLEFEGTLGEEFWMVFQNFYAITRYNQSKLYAMAVFQLAQRIEQAYFDAFK